MIVDLSAARFCQSSDIGELIGIDLPAGQAKLFMFKFHDCWVDMDKLFPVAAGLITCKALFRTYADHKYAEYYSPQFAGRLQAHAAADYEGAFVLGGSTTIGTSWSTIWPSCRCCATSTAPCRPS
jgi:hypothetical protein